MLTTSSENKAAAIGVPKTAENAAKKWEDYAIEVNSDVLNDIKKYSPVKR